MGNAIFYNLGEQEGSNVTYTIGEWQQLISAYDELERQVEGLRKLFDGASSRIATGQSKRLSFLCSHCHKETPLLLDGLLADAKALEAGSE